MLDWLARRFVDEGWSIKQMHRLILLSNTYRQSSLVPEAVVRADPENRLFGRMNRQRLEAEAIRDSLLAVAGRLDPTAAGPAYRDANIPRRTLYLMTVRSDRSGFRPLFDVADPTALVDRRVLSTVAPQALYLMNHPFVLEQSRALAGRILREAPADDRARIEHAYAILFARPPSPEEIEIGLATLSHGREAGEPANDAWDAYTQILLCTNEFLFVD